MAIKRVLTPQDQQRFRELLQASSIAALMDSRRWEPGDLAFKGGTCLHLAHGSARFSEDLDFMVRGGLSLDGLSKEVQRRLQMLPGVPLDMRVTVSSARDERNPHAFMVTLGGSNVIGTAKVKIELWQTPAAALKSLQVVVKAIPSATGAQAFVPTLTLREMLSDKVYALGARERLKARDVFDLWWLCDKQPMALEPEGLTVRLDIYPGKDETRAQTAARWISMAQARLVSMQTSKATLAVTEDLIRWLPSSWKMDQAVAADMMAVAVQKLEQGLQIMCRLFPTQRR